MALLGAASDKEDNTLYAFVMEYYLQCNKVDLLLQAAFSSEIAKQSAGELCCVLLCCVVLCCSVVLRFFHRCAFQRKQCCDETV